MMHFSRLSALAFSLLAAATAAPALAECELKASHPEWIFCDDFESGAALVGQGRYFEHDNNGGDFAAVTGVGREGSRGMRARWQTGEVEAGNLKVSFGRNPSAGMVKGIRSGEDFREVYYRMYVRTQQGWKGDPFKLSRATVVAKSDWSQAMIAHLWGDRAEHLQLDPVRCVDGSGNVNCSGYNDFTHMQWIGAKAGTTHMFAGPSSDKWTCVEVHVKLNDAGQSNGVHEFWLDDRLEARREGLNFVGAYKAYGINAVFLENHWNSGSPQLQERYFDNFVISTKKIGCSDAAPPVDVTPVPSKTGASRSSPSLQARLVLRFAEAAIRAGQLRSVDGRAAGGGAGSALPKSGAPGIYVGRPDDR